MDKTTFDLIRLNITVILSTFFHLKFDLIIASKIIIVNNIFRDRRANTFCKLRLHDDDSH